MRRIFHLITRAAGEQLLAGGTHAPDSLASEGFVHASYANQAEESWRRHFETTAPAWLLELDPQQVAADLKPEPSRGGADFPHIYRALARGDVLRRWDIGGAAGFPRLAEDAAADGVAGIRVP